jgi:hypothetical protein
MAPPDSAVVRAAIAALRTDAAMWDDISAEIRAAAVTAETLRLTGFNFSFAADRAGMTNLYGDVQQRIVQLMHEAADVHADLATRLRLAADGYESADEAAERALRGTY